MTDRKCRYCAEPIEVVEPKESCGWAHRFLPEPGVLRFWCGYDPLTDKLRRVEPRVPGVGADGGEHDRAE